MQLFWGLNVNTSSLTHLRSSRKGLVCLRALEIPLIVSLTLAGVGEEILFEGLLNQPLPHWFRRHQQI